MAVHQNHAIFGARLDDILHLMKVIFANYIAHRSVVTSIS